MRRGLLLAASVVFVAVLLGGCAPSRPEVRASLGVVEAMRGGSTEGFARADGPRPFRFPEDHGPHDGFRTEWWYLTGNLESADGRRFGYQLTFFRNAVAPPAAPGTAPRGSRWATRQVWMAHFALSDPAAGRFHHAERFAREAVGLAGAQAAPQLAVWLEDWRLDGGEDGFPLRLRAVEPGFEIDLELQPGKPVVLQGEAGLSPKGPEPGNASYYYSLTRMPTAGTVRSGESMFRVSGLSWLDREWSTSALGPGLVGWDWFALQLDDGRDLMLYRLRRADGSADPYSKGTLVEADGSARRLAAADFEIVPGPPWNSPRSGAAYPGGFVLRLPADGIELEVVPVLADQELAALVTYWEGAVDVRGRERERPLSGRGYLEMTGYAPTR